MHGFSLNFKSICNQPQAKFILSSLHRNAIIIAEIIGIKIFESSPLPKCRNTRINSPQNKQCRPHKRRHCVMKLIQAYSAFTTLVVLSNSLLSFNTLMRYAPSAKRERSMVVASLTCATTCPMALSTITFTLTCASM